MSEKINEIWELKKTLLKAEALMSLQQEDESYQVALKKYHNQKRKIKNEIAQLRRKK